MWFILPRKGSTLKEHGRCPINYLCLPMPLESMHCIRPIPKLLIYISWHGGELLTSGQQVKKETDSNGSGTRYSSPGHTPCCFCPPTGYFFLSSTAQ